MYLIVCLHLCTQKILHVFLSSAEFFQNQLFFFFRNAFRVSNSLDPVPARHFVRPDLDPNYLLKLSADDTSSKRVNMPAHPCCLICTISICRLMRSAVAHLVEH